MANSEHLRILRSGREEWRAWRNANLTTLPDLKEASLRDSDLSGLNLANANLYGANLRGANLYAANLDGADLSKADISGAYLIRVKLGRTRFRACKLGWTVFGDVNLGTCNGLRDMVHRGPSTVGIDTLVQSKGLLPREFLRGCGVPESILAYAEALVRNPIDFYSCFISYSSRDQIFAEKLYTDLQRMGVRCWFASHDISGGRKLHEQIDEAIHTQDRVLLILSEYSMNSEWVKTEIASARQKELQQHRQVLFPISLVGFDTIRQWKNFDADAGKDSAREIREYFIPDLSNWQDQDSYQKAFDRLLRDLKAEPPKT